MELTFLVSHDGKNLKRRQSRGACACCRRKKKRCYHNDTKALTSRHDQALDMSDPVYGLDVNSEDPEQDPATTGAAPMTQGAPPKTPVLQDNNEDLSRGRGVFEAPTNSEEDLSSRQFACDSNPVVTLLEEGGSRLERGQSHRGDVGGWFRHEDAVMREVEPNSSSISTHNRSLHLGTVSLLPPKQYQEALMEIYFRRIHPILPLMDETDIRIQFQGDTLSSRLIQSICLVASKDQSAASLLCLDQDSTILTLETFSNLLYENIVHNMPRKNERRRVTTIQILALLSLHEWGPTGFEDSSLHLMQAIHHAQTIGLHLVRPSDQRTSPSLKALFWCLWSLDRWNAAMNGRPVMIHDRDMGQKVDDVLSLFDSPFRTWLCLTDKLDEVIRFYRPLADGMNEQELDLPSFEELVESSDAWNTPLDILDSLDLFYHGIVILATHSKGLQGRSPPRMAKIRQSHSIFSIASLVRKQDIQNLLPVPMVAYVLSLAFSITYRHPREGKLPSARQTAKEHLIVLYQCLQGLDPTWWSASIMVRLGDRVLDDIQHERHLHRSIDEIRSNSPDMHTRSAPHQATTGVRELSKSGVDRMNTVERSEGASMNMEFADNHHIESDLSTNLLDFLDKPDMMTGDFDVFFDNFLDINFPRPAGDQLLLDLEIPNP